MHHYAKIYGQRSIKVHIVSDCFINKDTCFVFAVLNSTGCATDIALALQLDKSLVPVIKMDKRSTESGTESF